MVDETLMSSRQWLSKFAVALGGFLVFVGITLIGVFALVFSGVVDVSVFERVSQNEGYRLVFLGVLLVVGLLDVLSGIILRRR